MFLNYVVMTSEKHRRSKHTFVCYVLVVMVFLRETIFDSTNYFNFQTNISPALNSKMDLGITELDFDMLNNTD